MSTLIRRATAVLGLGLLAAALLPTWAISREAAELVDPTGRSPWVFTPEAQLAGPPQWLKNYEQGLDRGLEVGYGRFYFSLFWHDIQPGGGEIDLSGLDQVVIAAHDRGIELVIDLQTCDFSLPQPPTITGGYRRNTNYPNQPVCAPVNIEAAIPAWTAVVARYMPGGPLAQEQGWTDDYSVSHFEIENEPDSLMWIHGNWEAAPKDFALFLSKLVPAMRAINPNVTILAPALAQHARSLDWLDRMLSVDPASMEFASDEYRAAVEAGEEEIVGGGPYIDYFSYHEDFADWTSGVLQRRPIEIREVVARHVDNPGYPTTRSPALWFTEGAPGRTGAEDYQGQLLWTYANVQMAFYVVGSEGVDFMDQNFSTSNMDESSDFQQQPAYPMAKALVEYFPDALHIERTSETTTAAAGGEQVESYAYTDPVTGLRSMALWALSTPMGSGATEPDFTFDLPVATDRVLLIDRDWSTTEVATPEGIVSLTLQHADPSPVNMVVELPVTGDALVTPGEPGEPGPGPVSGPPASDGVVVPTAAEPQVQAAGAGAAQSGGALAGTGGGFNVVGLALMGAASLSRAGRRR